MALQANLALGDVQIFGIDPSPHASAVVEVLIDNQGLRTGEHDLFKSSSKNPDIEYLIDFQISQLTRFINAHKKASLKLIMIEGVAYPKEPIKAPLFRLHEELNQELLVNQSLPVEFVRAQKVKEAITGNRYATKRELFESLQAIFMFRLRNFHKTDALGTVVYGAKKYSMLYPVAFSIIQSLVTTEMELSAFTKSMRKLAEYNNFARSVTQRTHSLVGNDNSQQLSIMDS